MSNLMKILSVRAELFHEDRQKDRQTDLTKVLVPYRNLVKARKMAALL